MLLGAVGWQKWNRCKASKPLQNEHLFLTRAMKLSDTFPDELSLHVILWTKLENSQNPCYKIFRRFLLSSLLNNHINTKIQKQTLWIHHTTIPSLPRCLRWADTMVWPQNEFSIQVTLIWLTLFLYQYHSFLGRLIIINMCYIHRLFIMVHLTS